MKEKRNSEQSESRRLESLYRKASDPVLRTHLLMVWRVSVGDSLFEEIFEVEDALVQRCVELLDQAGTIRDLTNYHWWPQAG